MGQNMDSVSPAKVVKSFGVLFNENLNFEDHMNSVIQACNILLGTIGSKLNFQLKCQLIHCLIFSKINNCNGALFELPDFMLKKATKSSKFMCLISIW